VTAIGTLEIPAIDLEIDITVSGIGDDGLNVIPDESAGWLSQTQWIYDAEGPVVIGGHSVLIGGDPGVFYDLASVEVWDEIPIEGLDGDVEYIVINIYETNVSDGRPLENRGAPTLELVTCSLDDLNRRLIVEAVRQ
jgi:LPXTG-site transpeptidase (sortase) family protein